MLRCTQRARGGRRPQPTTEDQSPDDAGQSGRRRGVGGELGQTRRARAETREGAGLPGDQKQDPAPRRMYEEIRSSTRDPRGTMWKTTMSRVLPGGSGIVPTVSSLSTPPSTEASHLPPVPSSNLGTPDPGSTSWLHSTPPDHAAIHPATRRPCDRTRHRYTPLHCRFVQ